MRKSFAKLLEIMTPGERKRFWILVVITFGMTTLEAASVFSILPFLQLLADSTVIQNTPALAWAYSTFGFDSVAQFQIWVGLAVFLITVFGLLIKIATVWITTRFAMMRAFSFSSRLLSGYLHQPYEWFLNRHSADLGNAVLAEVDKVVSESLLPAMRLIPEAFLVILLISALSFMEPGIAIGGALLVGSSYALIFLFVRKTLTRIGEVRLAKNRIRFHVVQEATGGVRELKIMGLENGFQSRFQHAAFKMARAQTSSQIIGTLPRYALEAVAFGGMILLILVLLIANNGDIAALIPTLGLIAVVGLRLIPAVQQVYSRIATLRSSAPTLNRIHRDMQEIARTPKQPDDGLSRRPLTDTLTLQDIRYAYPNADRQALDGIRMEIRANTTIGIVGGTGAGKTTLIDMILGLLEPDEGQLIVDGEPVKQTDRRSWQRTLGYVPQTIFLADGTVAENIAFGQAPDEIDMDAVEKAAKTAALHDFVMTELGDGYHTHVGERGARLSGGQRQRIGIARALYTNPSTLVFDEATSALDTVTEAAVMEAVHAIAGQKTIIMIAHRLSTIRNCDRIFVLRKGKIAAAGTYDELRSNDDEFRNMAERA